MNYYSDQEIEQVIEEGNREPLPASKHVALVTETSNGARPRLTGLWAWAFWLLAFLFVLNANMVEVPDLILGAFAALLISVFVVVTIKGGK